MDCSQIIEICKTKTWETDLLNSNNEHEQNTKNF